MNDKKLFFILGAGASVDSGLMTYRGPEGIYTNTLKNPEDTLCLDYLRAHPKEFWEYHKPLFDQIWKATPGETYEKIKTLVQKNPKSFIMTQNIDGLVKICNCEIIEMHGSWETMSCLKCRNRKQTDATKVFCSCGGIYRPDVILFGEDLDQDNVKTIQRLKKHVNYVVIIGTTLTFPYLRVFINMAKHFGAKVIHINPDEEYKDNVKKGEMWLRKSSSEGLDEIMKDDFIFG